MPSVRTKGWKETPQKLAPIAEGTFTVLRVDNAAEKIVIRINDKSMETISWIRLPIALKPDHDECKIKEIFSTRMESTIRKYPTAEKNQPVAHDTSP